MTESLTTDLSRISGSFVIARNTAYAYKGRSVDVRAIGRELNVRYLMEGSVQRAAARMRVNVQLIAAESGAHLWAERFDKPLAESSTCRTKLSPIWRGNSTPHWSPRKRAELHNCRSRTQ